MLVRILGKQTQPTYSLSFGVKRSSVTEVFVRKEQGTTTWSCFMLSTIDQEHSVTCGGLD